MVRSLPLRCFLSSAGLIGCSGAMDGVLKGSGVKLPDNELGLNTLDELIGWTSSYFHFKQALEVIGLTPGLAIEYIAAFEPFADRFAQDLTRQRVLESRFPKAMREKIAAEKPHLAAIGEILDARAQGKTHCE